MNLKPGTRLKSAVDTTEVIVVRAGDGDIDLRCGGAAMLEHGGDGGGGEPDPAFAEGTAMGKRYADAELGLEVLCTKAGAGSLSIGEQALGLKDAKALPSSD